MTITVEEELGKSRSRRSASLLSMLDLQPLEGRNKVFIIDPADLMNAGSGERAVERAWRSRRKTASSFLITVNVHELLLTVRSRARYTTSRRSRWTKSGSTGVSDELARPLVARKHRTRAQPGLARLKSEREVVLDFLETVVTANEDQFQDLLSASADIARAKQDFDESHGDPCRAARRSSLSERGTRRTNRQSSTSASSLQRLAHRASMERLLQMAEFLGFIESSLKSYVNRQMLTDVLRLHCKRHLRAKILP